jgi:hypothetical protein
MNQQHKGIIVLHDIHKQSVMAISPVVEELLRQEYTFLAFDQGQFVKFDRPAVTDRSNGSAQSPTPAAAPDGARKLYRESWAVIIGINDYQKWPKLRYAVNDANGMEDALVSRFGFQRDHIRKLINGEATRQRIMEVLGDELSDSRKVQREDRVFFFFAGHGATRTLEDGRQIGFVVPADADRSNYYSTAISMTALREAADLIPAKHVYFVMDSCYSGTAMSRGAGAFSRDRSYLEEVTRRTARQILTEAARSRRWRTTGRTGIRCSPGRSCRGWTAQRILTAMASSRLPNSALTSARSCPNSPDRLRRSATWWGAKAVSSSSNCSRNH